MNRIWAPWRKAYLRSEGIAEKTGCLFCRLRISGQDKKNYILKRSRHAYAILNIYPYNNGHVLILPSRHVASLSDLNQKEKLDLLDLLDIMQRALQRSLSPHGFNVGLNLGQDAGAGIPSHLHLHLVPRWRGDVNFMPVLADLKVISESLDSVYRSLKKALKGRS